MDGLIAYALSKKYADEVGQSILDAGFKTQVEQDRSILQTVGQEKILYFIPKTTAKPSDGYDEYVYSNNAWEQVGATDVDLSSIDYDTLQNKPQINGVTLSGNKTPSSLSLIMFKSVSTPMTVDDCVDNNIIYRTEVWFNGGAKDAFVFSKTSSIGGVNRTETYQFALLIATGQFITRTKITPWGGIGTWSAWKSLNSTLQSAIVNSDGTITFTMTDGSTVTTTGQSVIGPQGAPGDDYVLTAQDKADIADIVLQSLPTTQGVLYGNTSN